MHISLVIPKGNTIPTHTISGTLFVGHPFKNHPVICSWRPPKVSGGGWAVGVGQPHQPKQLTIGTEEALRPRPTLKLRIRKIRPLNYLGQLLG